MNRGASFLFYDIGYESRIWRREHKVGTKMKNWENEMNMLQKIYEVDWLHLRVNFLNLFIYPIVLNTNLIFH